MIPTITTITAQLSQAIHHNAPSSKPELWAHPFRALYRKTRLTIRAHQDPLWLSTPQLLRLQDLDIALVVNPSDYMGNWLLQYGVWEPHGTSLLQSWLRPGMSFVDIGANCGYYSLLASRLVGASGAVHCFEPADEPRRRLESNLRLNNTSNVVVHSEAMAATSGQVKFYLSDHEDFNVLASMLPGATRRQTPTWVSSIKLDDFLDYTRLGSVDLIKIDVEGCEQAVIDGGMRALSNKQISMLMFEAHGASIHSVEASLEPFGYVVRRLNYSPWRGLSFHAVDRSPRHSPPDYLAAQPSALARLETLCRHR